MSNGLKKLTRERRRWPSEEQRAPGRAVGTGRAASDGGTPGAGNSSEHRQSSGHRPSSGRRDERRPARSARGFSRGSLPLTPHGKGDMVREGENERCFCFYISGSCG